ncbi:MAG TPA: DUF2203 domain-containing protein [Bryobacteraceae bacterium]|nr:DUF2203 domain-containing protein [Bryobacteraceae bacterium]
MSKCFTLQEAAGLLPQVGTLLREAVSLKSQHDEADQALQALAQRIALTGGMVVDRQTPLEIRNRRDQVAGRLKAALEEIQSLGVLVKDLDIGLIDFPTRFRGQEVYLCWKMGEPEIGFWHGVHEGYAGRKPIDQDFLTHHEGDKPH